MARQRKTETTAMKELAQRIAGMKSISPTLDLDNDVTVAEGEAILANSRGSIENYNSSLAVTDENLNIVNSNDKLCRAFNKKVLPAVGLKYGTDSDEYEKVGGVRESERKKRVSKPKDK